MTPGDGFAVSVSLACCLKRAYIFFASRTLNTMLAGISLGRTESSSSGNQIYGIYGPSPSYHTPRFFSFLIPDHRGAVTPFLLLIVSITPPALAPSI